MQNLTKSHTRLAFIQYIFQLEFVDDNLQNLKEDFEKHFNNSNITAIGEKKEFKLKFNKNFFNTLSDNYINNFEKKKIINQLNTYIDFNRKFEKWDNILKSIIIALISELQNTNSTKFKIVINDYLNISKSLVSENETKILNALIQKYIYEKEIIL